MSRGGLWTALPSLLVALAVLAASSARAATLWLSIPEGAEPCTFDQLAAALQSGLPDVRVEAGQNDLEPGDVSVALHREVEGWSLVVKVPGEHELRRKLPPAGVDCLALAQTAAFMVERYLGEVRWTGAQVVVAPVSGRSKQEPESRWQAVAELGVAGGSSTGTTGLGPLLDVDLGARKGPWSLSLSATGALAQYAGLPDDSQAVAEIHYRTSVLQLVEGRRLQLGLGTLRLELMPGAQLTWATLLGGHATLQTTFTIGARIAWEVSIFRRLFAALRVSGRLIVPQIVIANNEVGGLPAAPYESGYGALDASISVGYLLF